MSRTPHRNWIIVILGALATIGPFAIDMYLPAFPEIAAALQVSTARVSLSLSSYFAGMAAAQLFYGPLLDRFGRKRPLIFCVLYFSLLTVLTGLAPNYLFFVICRALYGIGMGISGGVVTVVFFSK